MLITSDKPFTLSCVDCLLKVSTGEEEEDEDEEDTCLENNTLDPLSFRVSIKIPELCIPVFTSFLALSTASSIDTSVITKKVSSDEFSQSKDSSSNR